MARVVKPISLTDEEHRMLLAAAKSVRLTVKEFVENVLVVFIAMVNGGTKVRFHVPQKVNSPKSYAISAEISEQVKIVSSANGVSQVNFIYSALTWHLANNSKVAS